MASSIVHNPCSHNVGAKPPDTDNIHRLATAQPPSQRRGSDGPQNHNSSRSQHRRRDKTRSCKINHLHVSPQSFRNPTQ